MYSVRQLAFGPVYDFTFDIPGSLDVFALRVANAKTFHRMNAQTARRINWLLDHDKVYHPGAPDMENRRRLQLLSFSGLCVPCVRVITTDLAFWFWVQYLTFVFLINITIRNYLLKQIKFKYLFEIKFKS